MSGALPASTMALTLASTSFQEYTVTSTVTPGWFFSYALTSWSQYFLELLALLSP